MGLLIAPGSRSIDNSLARTAGRPQGLDRHVGLTSGITIESLQLALMLR